ncbi:TonB-dependent receptor [Leptobacterium flavescens]|uniref:TonB-dependent receptor n=1 Tax=Leptobacterium flavescens TaxID=472055 RepID=A0A6P0UIJ7_9FLAO|nr:outer membrane beta-barrel family protein [Leptobacterium flavescens]NER12817.1 TonB-dependent receptor [Leptobacterium flavescens]
MRTQLNVFFLLVCSLGLAQNSISGKISDFNTNEIIGWADIILLKDDKVVLNTISKDDGHYELTGIDNGTYTLKVNYLGYQDFTVPVSLSGNSKRELDIKLKSNRELLGEVVLTAERTTIEFKSDKRVVNIGRDLLAAGASTENILRQIPSVDVDISGNVSLRNDNNVIIMIDGKRSTLSSADIIAQVPSNLIKQIEVITNPSAKYDAEGVSGLINIITRRPRMNGGNFSVNAGIGEQDRYHFTPSGNYRSGKFNFYVNYNLRFPYFGSSVNTLRQTTDEIIEQQTGTEFENARVNYLKSGVDIFIDSTNTLSFSGIYARNVHSLTDETATRIEELATGTERMIMFNSENMHIHVSKELNANYRKEFNGRNHYLEADINLANFPNTFQIDQREVEAGQADFIIDDSQRRENTITTLSADYHRKNKKGNTLETGLKAEFKNLDNFQDRTEQSETITVIEDNFLYEDRVLAAYVVYEHTFKKLSLKGGLRLEDYRIDLNSNDVETFDDSYTNLFPSFSLSYKVKENEFSANYTRRISRPGIFSLNPFTVEQGNLNRRRGNPFLRPSFANKVELNYNRKFKKINLNASAFYSQIDDVIQFIFIREGDFIINTFDNIGTSRQYGIELFSRINWSKWWSSNLSMNYYFSDFETQQFANTHTFSQQYRLQNDFRFAKSWSVQLNGNLNPRRQNLQQEIQTNYRLDLAVSKRILKNKGQLILRINDIFNTSEFDVERNLNDLSERTFRKPFSRYAYLTMRYNFSFGQNNQQNRLRKQRRYNSGNVD